MNAISWQCLEAIPGLSAVPAVWRDRFGDKFEWFRTTFLQTRSSPVKSFPCPRQCGCAHLIITGGKKPSRISARCQCEPAACAPLSLSQADILPLQLDWIRLGRALCHAFGLDSRPAALPLPNTRQIGSWSADAAPVVLTLQTDRHVFRRVLAELALRLKTPFILIAPTSAHLDAAGHELLADAHAKFFALASYTRLDSSGALRSIQTPGELFAKFTPQPGDSPTEDTIRKAFALVKALDVPKRIKQPSPGAVFGFHCIDGMSVAEIARKCRCSRGTVLNRLEYVRLKTGVDPVRLRLLSAQFERLEERTRDSRARCTSAKGLIYDAVEPDEEDE
jgi:hypothetical protein